MEQSPSGKGPVIALMSNERLVSEDADPSVEGMDVNAFPSQYICVSPRIEAKSIAGKAPLSWGVALWGRGWRKCSSGPDLCISHTPQSAEVAVKCL